MKTFFSAMLSFAIATLILTQGSNAQSTSQLQNKELFTSALSPFLSADALNATIKKSHLVALEDVEAEFKADKAAAKLLKGSFKARENFARHYKNLADARWYVGENAIVAYAENSKMQTRVIYDKRGSLVHTLKSYNADQLSGHIKSSVEYAFPEYDITSVEEVEEGANIFYIVNIKSNKFLKQVIWFNNEVTVYNQFNNAVIN